MVLESQDDLVVAGEAGDGDEAVRMTAELDPDIVLMDVRMPGVDGMEATRVIRGASKLNGGIPILALTADVLFGRSDLRSGMRRPEPPPARAL